MKLITKDIDYAVRAIVFMADSKAEQVSSGTLLKGLKISRPFLRKILHTLEKNNILLSQKGRGGGFRLIVKPEDIKLSYLVKIFKGEFTILDCVFNKEPCINIATCRLRNKMMLIEDFISLELKTITIESLRNR